MAGHADARMLATFAVLYVVSGVAYARLPVSVVDPALIAFLLPTAALTIYGLMRLLAARDRAYRSQETSSRTYDAIVFCVVLFIGALHGAVLIGLLGRGFGGRFGPVVPRLAVTLTCAAHARMLITCPRWSKLGMCQMRCTAS